MIKIGMIIGERFEILEKIGTGGMSDVYKAKDHKLNRAVAVKVLKQEFSENANFVSKFRTEAQAAAGLMHANIVNVYDVGEEGGIYYIVMELVEGITLKKYIEKKARLSVKEAVSIAIQVSLGIEAAHNNHIIHRDIKPQNIMISKEGRVKVTDFGIAKAATSNTITSNVMGSVHYTSPEQARGGYSDAKSDIYSLGITIFEMLTGRVPFNGETTVAIAIKHIQENMPSPREFVPEIPVSVEKIVLKCTQKSPDARYQSMSELVEDLKRSLVTPDEDFVVIGQSVAGETRTVSEDENRQIRQQVVRNVPVQQEGMRLNKNVRPDNQQGQKLVDSGKNVKAQTAAKAKKKPKDDSDDYNSTGEKVTTILMVLVAVVIGCIVIYIVGNVLGVFPFKKSSSGGAATESSLETEGNVAPNISTEVSSNENEGKMMLVPDVSNNGTWSQAEATKNLTDKGFKVEIQRSNSSTVPKGNVISQTPTAGETVPFGVTVTLLISEGQNENTVTVPNLLGTTLDVAEAALILKELALGTVEEAFSDDYAAGLVCYQDYAAGGDVIAGTVVNIKISKGPRPRSYSCNFSVMAPQDAEYNGNPVNVQLYGSDGTLLYSTTTNTFPVEISLEHIQSVANGQIIITYPVSITSLVIDDYGNEITAVTEEARNETHDVAFTEEAVEE